MHKPDELELEPAAASVAARATPARIGVEMGIVACLALRLRPLDQEKAHVRVTGWPRRTTD